MKHYYAAVTVKGFTTYRRTTDEPGIYDLLEPLLGHDMAADAAAWCQEAPLDAEYETDCSDVSITIVYF